jgi:uncharacterized oxidoreductase
MKMAGNTILITGGTSGLGFELAAQPLERKTPSLSLDETNPGLPQLARSCRTFIHLRSDVSDPQAIRLLFAEVTQRFPALNVLINNTGIMRKINLHDAADSLEDLTREIETNLVGPMQMIKQFLPYLKACKSPAAIMNVSSGLAFIPLPLSPIYCAAKAGLHSYTQSLRVQLKNTNVKVFELAAPGAKTSLNDIFAANEVDSRILMEPEEVGDGPHSRDGKGQL